MWEVVEELRRLMKDVPMYSAHFLSILSEVLIGYRDSLISLYKGISLSLSCLAAVLNGVYFIVSELTSGPGEGGVAGGGVGKAGGGALGVGFHDTIVSSKWAKDDDIKRMIM